MLTKVRSTKQNQPKKQMYTYSWFGIAEINDKLVTEIVTDKLVTEYNQMISKFLKLFLYSTDCFNSINC